jgi:drug/metabolite transporter, DME family
VFATVTIFRADGVGFGTDSLHPNLQFPDRKAGKAMRGTTGIVAVLMAGVLWSFMGLAIRNIEVAGTWAILFWRSLGTIPILLAFIAWRSGGHPVQQLKSVGLTGVLGGISLVVAFAGAIFAIQSTTVANAVFLFSASPFLAALLGWAILRESVRRATWIAIAVAAIGMFIMVREGLAAGALAGNVAALLSALGFATFTVALRWGRLTDMVPAVVLGGVFATIVAGIVLAILGQPLLVPAHDIAISMAMGGGVLATGMILYTLGSRAIPAAELTLLSLIEVMLAPIWVWLFLGETTTGATLVGGAILLAAVVFNAVSASSNQTANA